MIVPPTFLARWKICQSLVALAVGSACDRAPLPTDAPEGLVLHGARVTRGGATLGAERLRLARTARAATGLTVVFDEGFRVEAATATAAADEVWWLTGVSARDPAGRRLETTKAAWDGRQIRSDAPTRLTGDNFRGEARGWVYDRAERRLQFRGPVRLKLSRSGPSASPRVGQPR